MRSMKSKRNNYQKLTNSWWVKIQDEVSLFYSGPNNDKMHQHSFLPQDIINGFIVYLNITQIGTR